MAKEMSKVLGCEATQCIYNKDKKCHTLAITIGDEEPCCDTFYQAGRKGGVNEVIGGVGACKVDDCKFNNQFECRASGIQVVMNVDHPDCGTFQQK